MPLDVVAPELWSVVHPMRFPGGVRMPARMTIVRLGGGELLIHSPVPIDDALAGEIAALGPVRYVLAPNCFHHLYVGPLSLRFPEAQLYGAPGLVEKRRDINFAGTLGNGTAPWGETLEAIALRGVPKTNEVVFFHRPSRTLLVTDVLFNVTAPETWVTALTLRILGTYKRLGPSRVLRFLTKDRKALRPGIERMLDWDFTRVVPAHGSVYEGTDARDRVRAGFDWILA
jgi:hypothetical protein